MKWLNNPHITSLIGVIVSGICTIIVARIQTHNKRRNKIEDDREKRQCKYNKLIIEMLSASCDLGLVNAIALQGGQLNGNVDEAVKRAEKAQREYRNFLQSTIAKEL